MKEKFQQKTWFWKRRSQLYLDSSELKNSTSKFKGSIFAIILGLLIGVLVVAGTGNNPITYFQYLLFFAFSSYGFNNWDTTLLWWTIYIVAGLALLVSFKTGMFNIGITGQMLAAGAVVLAIGIRYDLSQPVTLLIAFIAGILAAMLVSMVTILLKVLFNIHEVVTSILLNWTVWYLVKWAFTTSKDLYDSSSNQSMGVHDSMNMAINGYKFILPLIIALFLVFAVWFIFKKTTLGYKVKTVGLNPFAADYGGISRKRYAFISFAISGALAGVMAVIFYIGLNPSLSFMSDDLPTVGFDGIAVALVGQSNAVGVLGAAFLWGVIKSGGQIGSVGLNIPAEVSDIIFGVIIYSAACAILLSRLEPIKAIIRYLNVNFGKEKRSQYYEHLRTIFRNWKNVFQVRSKNSQDIKNLKNIIKETKDEQTQAIKKQELYELMMTKKDNVQVAKAQVQQERKSLKNFYHQEYDKLWTTGLMGINHEATENKKALFSKGLDTYITAKIIYEENLHKLKESYRSDRAEFKKQSKIEAEKFNKQFVSLIQNEQQQLEKIAKTKQEQRDAYKQNKSINKSDVSVNVAKGSKEPSAPKVVNANQGSKDTKAVKEPKKVSTEKKVVKKPKKVKIESEDK